MSDNKIDDTPADRAADERRQVADYQHQTAAMIENITGKRTLRQQVMDVPTYQTKACIDARRAAADVSQELEAELARLREENQRLRLVVDAAEAWGKCEVNDAAASIKVNGDLALALVTYHDALAAKGTP